MPTPGFVYLLASRRNGTLYVGVTSDLVRRIAEHKTAALEGFTKEYGVARLVYVEAHADIEDAIRREKQIKKWRRAWKLRLIEVENPTWLDLYPDWCEALVRTRPTEEARDSGTHLPNPVIPAQAGIQDSEHTARFSGSPPARG